MNISNVTDFIADFMTTTTVNIMTTMRFDNSSDVNNGTSDASDGDPSSDDMSMSLEAKLIKAHGIIMIFAWLVFASFGMLMPRYFKPAWPGKTWCGKAIWFQLHQPCMIITLLLTAAGFIIIFCSSKEYCNDLDHPGHEHPPLGIIVMILVILNPIMAAFRPEPNAERRIIFNVLHFIVGLLAHLTSIVVIFLATYIDEAVSDDYKWCRWVLVAYIIWHSLVEVTLAIHMHVCVKRTTHEKQGFPMDAVQGHRDHADHQDMKETPTGGGSIFKTFVIVMHSIVAIGCTVAIAVAIGLSVPPAAD